MLGKIVLTACVVMISAGSVVYADGHEKLWVEYPGGEGPGAGKHIVLISGDDEYRSEEALPMLGKILSVRHGFRCTVLFPIDPESGVIVPDYQTNIPGLAALDDADLMIMFLRFRELPDDQMKHIVDYVRSGRPIIAMRTSTHAFHPERNPQGTYAHWGWLSQAWPGGFGKQILGESWFAHHGHHGAEATRGIIPDESAAHPILRGIRSGEIFGPSDVYAATLPLPGDSLTLVLGEVVAGMKPTDPPVRGKKNDPMMPIAWLKSYQLPEGGMTGKAFTTTMGAATDLENDALRRMMINSVYYMLGMEVPDKAEVAYVGHYDPTDYSFGGFKKGVRPSDHALE